MAAWDAKHVADSGHSNDKDDVGDDVGDDDDDDQMVSWKVC